MGKRRPINGKIIIKTLKKMAGLKSQNKGAIAKSNTQAKIFQNRLGSISYPPPKELRDKLLKSQALPKSAGPQ